MEKRKQLEHFFISTVEHKFAVPILTALTVLFYALTLREGQHVWDGDFSQYIHHAKNLAEGENYFATQYLVNAFGFVGPYAYPPVFPLLLTPVLLAWGVNLFLLKLVVVACFGGMLISISKIFADRLSRPMLLLLLLAIGFNPAVWQQRDFILSEFSFMMFSFLSLYLIQRSVAQPFTDQKFSYNKIWLSILLGFTMYLAYGTREIGFILPIALVTYELLKTKRISVSTIIALLVFATFFFAQYKLFQHPPYAEPEVMESLANLSRGGTSGGEVSHFKYVNFDLGSIITQAHHYAITLKQIFPPTDYLATRAISWVLLISLCAFALLGFVASAIKNISVLEIYLVGYLSVILLFGGPTIIRYLLPIIPFIFYYAFVGGTEIYQRGFHKYAKSFIFLFVTASILLYTVSLVTTKDQAIEAGITDPSSKEMLTFVGTHTKPGDTIVFGKPRVLALFTGRKSASYSHSIRDGFFLQYLNTLGADYVIDARFERGEVLSDKGADSQFYTENKEQFINVFNNKYFTVYRYKPIL